MPATEKPAFRLFLLRHARAAWAQPGGNDFDRPLDDEGYAEAEAIAEEMADQGYRPELVLSSTAVRCRETAEPLRRTLGEELDLNYVDSLYSGPTSSYAEIAFAPRVSASVMLVGHNPMVEEFFHRILGTSIAETAAPFGYPTAGLAVLDFDSRPTDDRFEGARLSCFITPRTAS
ncbi:histidine phosphatase family protein [Rhizobium sp. TRM95111]|uniref:SixA phosphatase family protein n=1 Tax=Rhizobium alarense TaxID=2846851 RepID=UPI001F365D53|nr:histidine phosphatase family protein [Rhizobium alarense]MCF3642414.1 histidine phosphatase family protein [Rhizobium alarense]